MKDRDMESPGHGKFPLLLILSASALGIFLLPWYVPVSEPANSQSYTYGFNNSVAILAIGLTLAALFVYTLYHWQGRQRAVMEAAITDTFCMPPDRSGDRSLLLSFIGAAIISSSLVAACYWYTPFSRWGEMTYFLVRIDLLILHRMPYYDFPFSYGPAMLYGPYWLYKAAHGLLSVEQAYCVTLILHWILGLYLFACCVRLLVPPSRQSIVFWVFALTFLNPTLGCSYAPLRFVLPIAAVLFSHHAVLNASPGRFRGHLRVALAAFLGAFLNFESSPEMGLAVTLALLVYFVALLRTARSRYAHGAVMALLGALAAVSPWSTAYLDVLFTFGGSASIPAFPSPAMLYFLAGAYFFLPRLAVIGFTSREANGPASLAFCVFSGILIIPALSRCDLGHIFLNGLAVIVLAAAILARLPDNRWFKGALAALFLIFPVFGGWLFLFHYSVYFKSAIAARSWMRSHPMPASQPASHGFLFSKQYPPLEGLDPLLAYGSLATPLGCSEDIEHFLLLHGRYQCGYNPGICSDVSTLKQTVRQARDLDAFRTVLVPKSDFAPAPPPDAQLASDYRFLRNQTFLPVRLVPHHPFFNPERVLAARISQQFFDVGEFRDYLIMVNRAGKKD